MRIVLFFITIGFTQAFALDSYAQAKRISLNMEKQSIQKILETIEEQTEFRFMYDATVVDVTQRRTVKCKNKPVSKILEEIFENSMIAYKVEDRQIALSSAQTFMNVAAQQQRTVSGKVTELSGQPLPGVAVIVKGTSQGTVTNSDGRYSLSNITENTVLQFSFVGMKMQEIAVAGKQQINVVMEEEAFGIDEVVVTALGLKREKKALGYSVGEVKGELLTETGQSSVLNALQGKVAGVKIDQTSGYTGSSVNMIIRGVTSLNNDNQPLFVIDGVPVKNRLNNVYFEADFGNQISDLNPEDIESVSVLKGASAAALYGSRAGNGVVLITTRSGQGAKKGIGVSISSSNVVEMPYQYFPVQNKFGSGKAGAHLLEESENESWGMQLDVGETAVLWNSDGEKAPVVSYPNRFKDFFKPGFTTTNNIGVEGNYDKGFFRLSASDMRHDGIMPNIDLNRTTISLNSGYNVTKKLKVSAMFSWAESNSDNRPSIGNDRDSPIRSLYEMGAQVNILDLKDYWIKGQEGIQQFKQKEKQNNPYFVAYEMTRGFKREMLTSKVQFDYQFTNELSLMGRFTRAGNMETREQKKAFSSFSEPQGYYSINDSRSKETNMELSLSYKKNFDDKWNIDAFIAGNRMYSYGHGLANTAPQLVTPGLYTISNGVPGTVLYSSSWSQKAIYSVYGMVSLGYSDMIYLDLTARNDWSSTLPIENRSYFYPSASLSVLLSEIFTLPQWISFAKLRSGIAQVGNDVGPYSLTESFSIASDWGTSKRMYRSGGLKNPNLVPEKNTSTEVGAELRFLNNRISLEATWYQIENANQVIGISIPVESGATSKTINAGIIESKGWEVSLNSTPVSKGKFNWDLGFNFTKNKSRLVQLAEGMSFIQFNSTDGAYFRTYVGEYIGDFYCQPMLTVKDTESPYYGYPLLNANGQYQTDTDPDNIMKIGNSNPDFTFGIQNTFRLGSFSLYANVDWSQGGKFYSSTMMFAQNNGQREDTFSGVSYDPNRSIEEQIKENPEHFFGEWVGGRTAEYGGFPWPEGQGAGRKQDASFNVGVREVVVGGEKTYVENLGGETTKWMDPFNANRYPNRPFPYRNTYDATYLKLREVALAYHIPKKFSQKLHIQNSTLSLIATNFILWTKANINIDPERAYRPRDGSWSNGVEYYNTMPWTGTLGLKLNVEF